MRKLKLLFAACALMLCAGVQAQNLEAGTYYIYNVQAGKYITAGANWGTHSVLAKHGVDFTVTLNDGAYTLITKIDGATKALRPSDGYMDQSGTWTISPESDGTYTIQGSAGYLRYNGTNILAVNGSSTDNGIYWEFRSKDELTAAMASATVDNPVDATHFITAPDFVTKDYRITSEGAWSGLTTYGGNGATMFAGNAGQNNSLINNTNAQSWNTTSFNFSQTLTGLPKGTYRLMAYGFYRAGSSGAAASSHADETEALNAIMYAGSAETPLMSIVEEAGKNGSTGTNTSLGYVPNSQSDAASYFEAGCYANNVVYFNVDESGEVTIGVKKDTKIDNDWTVFDNFDLTYYGESSIAEVVLADYVRDYNEALGEAQGYLAQGMFEADAEALSAVISANTLDLNNVTQEQLETATANLRAANLVAGPAVEKYYVYTTAQTLIAGNTNVNLTGLLLNADFETGTMEGWTSVDGGAQANNRNFSLMEGDHFVERWRNGAALGNGSLTHDVICLPAGFYTITAEAQNIKQYDENKGGKGYFLCANDERAEIGLAGTYSTSVMLTDAQELTIKFLLEDCTGNWISCDHVTLTYVGDDFPSYTLVTGKMNAEVAAAQTAADEAFQANQTVSNYNAVTAAITAAQTSVDAYAAAAMAVANAKEIQTKHNFASSTAAATFAEAIAAIENPYNDNTLTTDDANGAGLSLGSVITDWRSGANSAAVAYLNDGFSLNAFDAALYINTWSTEGEGDGSNFKVPFYEYFGNGSALATKTWTATLTDLDNGLYSVSAWVRVQTTAADVADATGITMDVNGGEAIDATAGTQVGDTKFLLKEYTAEGLVKDGTLNFNMNILDGNNISWLSFKNVMYTKVRDLTADEQIVYATAEDLEALNAAIEAAEEKTLGFLADEYAPYNNVEALVALKAANDIDQTSANLTQEEVQNATAALNDATWTANTEEVNAVYDGTFAAAENNGAPAGWTMSNNTLGGAYHSRAFVGDERLSEFNETYSGLFLRFDGTNSDRGSLYYYGNTVGYTMPLAEGVTYRLTVDAANWGANTNKPLRLNVAGPEGFTAVSQTINTQYDADQADNAPQKFDIVFVATVAGNYNIIFQCPGSDDNKHNVIISNVSLMSAQPVSIDISDAGYATYCSDVALDFVDTGLIPYAATISGSDVIFNPIETGRVPAGVGILIGGIGEDGKAPADTYEVRVVAEAETVESALIGVIEDTEVEAPIYVLMEVNDDAGFCLTQNKFLVRAHSAYLPYLGDGARFISINGTNGTTTGIAEIENVRLKSEDSVYNLNGQRLSKPTKGLYIVNGKKVAIK